MIPDTLNTPEFCQAWEEWLAYRKRYRFRAYKPVGEQRQLKALAQHGVDAAIMAINHSMDNTYQGLFPDKFVGKQRFTQRGNGAGEFSGAF